MAYDDFVCRHLLMRALCHSWGLVYYVLCTNEYGFVFENRIKIKSGVLQRQGLYEVAIRETRNKMHKQNASLD